MRRILGILLTLFLFGHAWPGTVSVGWDPIQHPDIAGYRVYVGESPGNYSTSVDVPVVTDFTVGGLSDCRDYFLAVKAVDSSGNESGRFSNEVGGWPRPRVDPPSVVAVPSEGDALYNVDLTGANFQAGAGVEFESPAIDVESVTVNDCNSLSVAIRVPADAPRGQLQFAVFNPDSVFGLGVLPVGFSIVPNVRRVDTWAGFGN